MCSSCSVFAGTAGLLLSFHAGDGLAEGVGRRVEYGRLTPRQLFANFSGRYSCARRLRFLLAASSQQQQQKPAAYQDYFDYSTGHHI